MSIWQTFAPLAGFLAKMFVVIVVLVALLGLVLWLASLRDVK